MSAELLIPAARPALPASRPAPGTWRMCERQPDAVVSDDHTMGHCFGDDESAFYGGHFVAESVRAEYRPLILAAPALLALAKEEVEAWVADFDHPEIAQRELASFVRLYPRSRLARTVALVRELEGAGL